MSTLLEYCGVAGNWTVQEPEKAIFYVAPWRCDDWWFLFGEKQHFFRLFS